MLSIEECRALIPDGDKLSDKEVEDIRENLFELAELALEKFHQKESK